MQVIGVDGTRTGWIAVTLENGAFAGAALFPAFADVLRASREATCVAVDIPIGLPERGFRPADKAAKSFLSESQSRVFPTPPRAVLEEPTHADAVLRARDVAGAGISQQSFALRKKIFEVDALVEERVVEIHPEVSFFALAGRPLPAKKTWNGLERRRTALAAVGIALPNDLGAAGTGAPDDILDAAAAAWSALRYARGEALPLPDPPPVDRLARPVAIWY